MNCMYSAAELATETLTDMFLANQVVFNLETETLMVTAASIQLATGILQSNVKGRTAESGKNRHRTIAA